MTSTMVVPNCDNIVLQNFSSDVVSLTCLVCEVFLLNYFNCHADPFNAAPQIVWMTEVVEGNSRIVIHFGVIQLELTY
ncbi:hypothetical protein A2U01_0001915 [Trifolium medium]|uniref:Uncharacterized protein n=1 Tax=Trifolium medium TaxID=97028 RepID=A0A392M428_9FABA|nr:hypothetical protein [Trifolium medium]